MLSKPRYEARRAGARFQVFDTFVQEPVYGGDHPTLGEARARAAALNRAYERLSEEGTIRGRGPSERADRSG
jgi:hypothetical protein